MLGKVGTGAAAVGRVATRRCGVSREVQIVERAMHKLTRPGLHPDAVEMAEQLLTQYAPSWALWVRRYALSVVDAADPDGPEPLDDHLQHNRRHLELKQRRDGMWHLAGNSPTLWVPNSTPS